MRIEIGIDPGVKTGFAVTHNGFLLRCCAVPIHKAMRSIEVELIVKSIKLDANRIHIRIEDARKRKWFGNAGREMLQGAGSIKRDCKIWEDYLTDLQKEYPYFTFEFVAPKNIKTKLNAQSFNRITGWEGKTNEHTRDAAMLVWKHSNKIT